MTSHDRLMGALWGAVVGDALGVPVEFSSREERRRDPVAGVRGFGTWNQPPGTWSDDSYLLLATVESLLEGYDLEHMGKAFAGWLHEGKWRPHGRVFDIGGTTRHAIDAIYFGTPAEEAGQTSEQSNGNGSLMRILPIGLAFWSSSGDEICEAAERASSLTHGHAWSRMACAYYCLLARRLFRGEDKFSAVGTTTDEFVAHYKQTPFAEHLSQFDFLINESISTCNETKIDSSGFVLSTLNASVWCLLRETSYSATVLRAINLGGDTDTTACVVGGLAGLIYGRDGIPEEWFHELARKRDLAVLFSQFATAVLE